MKIYAVVIPSLEIGAPDCFCSLWRTREAAQLELERVAADDDLNADNLDDLEIREVEIDKRDGCFDA